ncbi:polysaccharide deacetylase family protein [Paenibacillus aceris]|uniref:Peptidoglycan/xylan/chitin deacetylase (PgdA/CDA1 family) n=1 Tax=Paenibacillus aceris TaxID=869555 RepID=A0ABS4I169_9BACL|nr:polysaccharide deacetylase family protein [Paenibacillus aceris]MBP1964669.1 peptidoglycan/xylan/chitin deacetylase (PgdA/CDA1 family) [Paenibacillus aceris]NHW33657.1 polysaccharide deacetylase [Paenibacillus aceris]
MGDRIRRTSVYVMGLMISVNLVGCSTAQIHTEEDSEVPQQLSGEKSRIVSDGSQTPAAVDDLDTAIVETRHFYTGPPHLPHPAGDKIAYLTFDDGPSASTRTILRILKNNGAVATFFVIGNETSEGKSLYREIVAEGHALGNHTFSHDYNRIYKTPEAFMRDVRKLDQLLERTVGYRPDILRFPGGSNNHLSWKSGGKGVMSKVAAVVREEGYQYFDWNVSSTDAAAPVQDRDMIIDSVLSASKGKKRIIVLMHDNTYKTTTVEALPVVISKLKAAGFRFDKLQKASFTFQFLEP